MYPGLDAAKIKKKNKQNKQKYIDMVSLFQMNRGLIEYCTDLFGCKTYENESVPGKRGIIFQRIAKIYVDPL